MNINLGTFDDNAQVNKHVAMNADAGLSDHKSLNIELSIKDSGLIEAIMQYPEGRVRNEYILKCLKIGSMAIKNAEGQVDAQTVRDEGGRLLAEMEHQLSIHRQSLTEQMTSSLKEYFDPSSGRLNERMEALLAKDGELERVLRAQVGGEDSTIAKTLADHLGEKSPIFKVLNPSESDGILQSMSGVLEKVLEEDREDILKEFSLDNTDSALSRLTRELQENHGKMTGNLQDSMKELIGEFSLDNDESALSRLVKQVESAQQKISSEFSLDTDSSALARMKKELMDVLSAQKEDSARFQMEIRESIASLQTRKAEAARSTQHGKEFESELFNLIRDLAANSGDIASSTGNKTGLIKNCKVGDYVVELGPEHMAAGARIVLEAKDSSAYDTAKALAECDTARKNRSADIGVFVFSKATAPEGLDALTRYGDDILTIWDIDDPDTDLFPKVALSLAQSLCTRKQVEGQGQKIDIDEMDRAIREVEKQASALDEISTWTKTIKSNSEKIIGKVGNIQNKLAKKIDVLDTISANLKAIED